MLLIFFLCFPLPLPLHLIDPSFDFFMVSVTSLSVPVVFAIDVVDDLEVDVALVEKSIVVELVEM